MTRHQIREHLFKLVYMIPFTEGSMEDASSLYLDLEEVTSEEERAYIGIKLQRITDLIPEIDSAIGATAKGWRIDRMSRVDLAILRLAVFELRYDPDIPEGVAINEAVELAKEYGGEESPAFINGILGALSRE